MPTSKAPTSSDSSSASRSTTGAPTTAPSSPPDMAETDAKLADSREETLRAQEKLAKVENARAEAKRAAAKKKSVNLTPQEKAEKAKELDALLRKSKIFSDILTKKTKALGRVGRDFDNQALRDADVQLQKQPKIMSGGTMRDYQLEGLTWMYEICLQGLSGILADEMGLGKTIQTIALVALLREQENYYGPHLIIAPLSTLSNWQDEFKKWTPSIPFTMYHGTPDERRAIFKDEIMTEYKKARGERSPRPSAKFPVVCTSYEMILKDRAALSKIDWAFIVVDEGHRMKNADAKLFRDLQQFKSATRLLITGTPLQNNLKELWSLLHFLLPQTFIDWESFESWFDFSDLQDEEGTQQFIGNKENQGLVKKIHEVLQPLLLRRIKADVAKYLPKKREYVLYAPMTKEQTDLYNIISDKGTDTRAYLENKAFQHLTSANDSPGGSSRSSGHSSRASTARPTDATEAVPKVKSDAFAAMMTKKVPAKNKTATPTKLASKRKAAPATETPEPKSAKTSRPSSKRGRPRRSRVSYKPANESEDDMLDDDEFEANLARQLEAAGVDSDDSEDQAEAERVSRLEEAKKQIKDKKLGNPLMQLRLVCNSPHNFYNPWNFEGGKPVDESIVNSSGKMLLLDRLLPELFSRGHKALIFSQFKTQLDILHDYCAFRDWNVCRIDGGVSQADRRVQIKEFNENPDFKVFLLSTRAGGQGINLAAADTVVLFDSDWNPQQDLQAQDRCHRIGQTRPVVVYRLATKGTVEEELLTSADAKRRLEKLVIRKGGFSTMGQKLDHDDDEALDKETLSALLLKDGEVYRHSGGDRIFTNEDLDVLLDRSDEAFDRAAMGAGNADGFQVVDTAADGITLVAKK